MLRLKNKKWERPKLTVLARDNRQERILAYCKYSGEMPASSANWHAGCDFLMFDSGGHGRECRNCSMRFAS
ncbi:MAG: hypothetical protein PHT31_01410 [Candidatus Omnitrophica bacterium]|nr:hypothetical protein [Candidatus Omnitrophota bacterium]MDD5652805.1 hypothetical protein [Candidatus Omnitrophota bacterium]